MALADDRELELMRRVVEDLARLPRLPTSDGEREAAHYVRSQLKQLGYSASIEEVPAVSSYAWPIGVLSGLAAACGLAGRSRRLVGTIGGALIAAAIADDVAGGRRLFRQVAMPKHTAHNVAGYGGDPDADRTIVLMAHHDAAPSGLVFDQRIMRAIAGRRPEWVQRARSNPPLWWPAIAAPALVAIGSATGSRAIRRLGIFGAAGSVAAMVDIGRRPAVPGANDNLTGVAALLAVAERLRDQPVDGLRVVVFSAGAEEALQEGVRGFADRHFADLPTDRTWFLNLDTLGSGQLIMLEGEGPVRMRDYDQSFRDLVARCAEQQGIALLRGLRSRNSTDSEVPRRHGYPVATLVSLDEQRQIPHYHLDTDLPRFVDYGSVTAAVRLTEAVVRELAT